MQKDCLITYSTISLFALHVSRAFTTVDRGKKCFSEILDLFCCSFNCSPRIKLLELETQLLMGLIFKTRVKLFYCLVLTG
jgi:hypothetical protein